MKQPSIEPDMAVDEIMRRWPATVRVFMRWKMLCIGCPIGIFHTVRDVCTAHDVEEEGFAEELLSAMRTDADPCLASAFAAEAPQPRPG